MSTNPFITTAQFESENKKINNNIEYVSALSVLEQKQKKEGKSSNKILEEILQTEKNPRKVILPWYVKYLFFLIWLLIICFVVLYYNALHGLNGSSLLNWWEQNDGASYNEVFSIQLLILYSNFSLGYDIASSLKSKELQFETRTQAQFMSQLIYSYGKLNATDKIRQLVPKNLFETIVPVNYMVTNQETYKDLQNTDVKTAFDKNGWPIGPSAKNNWMQILKNWGATPQGKDLGKWTDNSDNFLKNVYMIDVNSPVIRCFLSQTTDVCEKTLVNNSAFGYLVGAEAIVQSQGGSCGNQCGWWGFIRNGFKNTDITFSDVSIALYSTQSFPIPSQKKCPTWGQSVGAGAIAGSGLFASVVGFGAKAYTGFFGALLSTGITALAHKYNNTGDCEK
jgi:hypothetical protein